jgi:hypothetical protein
MSFEIQRVLGRCNRLFAEALRGLAVTTLCMLEQIPPYVTLNATHVGEFGNADPTRIWQVSIPSRLLVAGHL